MKKYFAIFDGERKKQEIEITFFVAHSLLVWLQQKR
jgi:hypothetical protein